MSVAIHILPSALCDSYETARMLQNMTMSCDSKVQDSTSSLCDNNVV